MPCILETIVTTTNADGTQSTSRRSASSREGERLGHRAVPSLAARSTICARRCRSRSRATPTTCAIFAGCLTGRRGWPTVPCRASARRPRCADAFAHGSSQSRAWPTMPTRPRFLPRRARGRACAVRRLQPRPGGGASKLAILVEPASTCCRAKRSRRRWPISQIADRQDRRRRRGGSLGLDRRKRCAPTTSGAAAT